MLYLLCWLDGPTLRKNYEINIVIREFIPFKMGLQIPHCIHIPIQELEFWPGGPQIFHLRRASVFIDTEREAEGKFEE